MLFNIYFYHNKKEKLKIYEFYTYNQVVNFAIKEISQNKFEKIYIENFSDSKIKIKIKVLRRKTDEKFN